MVLGITVIYARGGNNRATMDGSIQPFSKREVMMDGYMLPFIVAHSVFGHKVKCEFINIISPDFMKKKSLTSN